MTGKWLLQELALQLLVVGSLPVLTDVNGGIDSGIVAGGGR